MHECCGSGLVPPGTAATTPLGGLIGVEAAVLVAVIVLVDVLGLVVVEEPILIVRVVAQVPLVGQTLIVIAVVAVVARQAVCDVRPLVEAVGVSPVVAIVFAAAIVRGMRGSGMRGCDHRVD